MSFPLHDALLEGALVVTPNRRLARVLHREFDLAQYAAGRMAWPTPAIVPYATWLEVLWRQSAESDASASAPLLLTSAQTGELWRTLIDADGMTLLNPEGAATLAADAWSLVHEWGAGGESWRGWRDLADQSDDAAIFTHWAEAYLAHLQRAAAVDLALLPRRLAAQAGLLGPRLPATILAGFTELSPQQDRLCAALAAGGADLRRLDTLPDAAASASRTLAASPRDEIAAALDWARGHAERGPGARIGIVIEDLAERRDEVVALAEERLCPGLILPNAVAPRRPFEISLGQPLASVPIVLAALDLIALLESRVAAGTAAALLRSPYLPGAEEAWAGRAGIERGWLDAGRREVTLGEAIGVLGASSPELAARWREGRDAPRQRRGTSPRDWVDAWRTWLRAAGWPGSRALDSAEYQAREAWERMLGEFASLSAVTPRLAPQRALDALRTLAGQTLFQPEGSDAPIQILGALEGTGLRFDALWVAGLTADRWPRPPAPNPLLPLAWQRARNVPRASAARELAYAETLTERFARAAPEVVFSSAASADDHELSPSALILRYPERHLAASATTWVRSIAQSATLESVADERAPGMSAGSRAPGGSRIVAAQSDCPFQAVARHRLGAEPWPSPRVGLSPPERGRLVHSALAKLWGVLADHATLVSLDAASLAARIESAVAGAIAELPRARWRALPPAVGAGEAARLAALLDGWLALERVRPPFAVRQLEALTSVQLGGIAFRLRLDRVDNLASGGLAILDYKTGRIEQPAQWFDERPRASQLGLYVLAQRAADPDLAVRAVAYAQLAPGSVAASGLAADKSAWPGLGLVASVGPCRDWAELESWWTKRLGALAAEIARGEAAVAPRESPLPCRNCGLYAVCRIESVRRIPYSDAEPA